MKNLRVVDMDTLERGIRAEYEPAAPLPYHRGEGYTAAPKREMVVKGLMGAGELTFTHGPPKSGKSFLMTSLGLAVADEGAECWWGHRIKRRGQVLYLVQEGAGGFPNRLEAWKRTHHGQSIPDAFVWTAARLNFFEEGTEGAAVEDVRRVAELVAALEAETDKPVVLIVIDTAARVTAGADENSARDMGQFLAACAALQDLPNRPHVNVVAHDNAGGTRMRGSSARQGGGDGLIHVERNGDERSWCLELAKDDPETERRGFRLEAVDLGEDEDGDRVTSCAVVEAEAAPRVARPSGGNERLVYDSLVEAINAHGEPPPPGLTCGGRVARVARVARWQEAATRFLPQPEAKRKTEAFNRAMVSLTAKNVTKHESGYAWLPPSG